MGSRALQKVSDASEAEISSVYAELSPEAQKSLRVALELCSAAPAAPAFACRAILSGEVTELRGVSKEWDYVDLAMALRKRLEAKDKVIKFYVSGTPIDEYQTLGEQGLDANGEVQYWIALKIWAYETRLRKKKGCRKQ